MNTTNDTIQGDGFEAKIVRSARRKTASIKIDQGEVTIVVPRSTRIDAVHSLLGKKTDWIRQKLRIQEQHQPPRPKEYVSGECFDYLGRHYRLKLISGPMAPVKLAAGCLVVSVPPNVADRNQYIRSTLTVWYKNRALEKLQEKVHRYANLLGVTPASVGIETFTGRWGSCAANGRMEFNWRIIIAPNHIVDYVVVHELCHLLHHNHSPEFWKCVERIFPDYLASKEWLKVHGAELVV